MNRSSVLTGSCLCGDVTYESSQKHNEMWNCHCHSCRKANSVAYATWIKTQVSSFRWMERKSTISTFSSHDMERSFCSKCGSILPARNKKEGYILLPAGAISTPHHLVPAEDRYVDQMPAWYRLGVDDARAQGSKPKYSEETLKSTDLNCTVRGSCMCGSVSYLVTGEAEAIRGCHCSRCRYRSGSGFFTGMPMVISKFHVEDTAHNLRSFKLPETQYYSYRFCGVCATLIPMIFPGSNRTVIAAGSLDSEPPVALMFHIFYASKASWLNLSGTEKCFDEHPPNDYDWKDQLEPR